MYRISLKYKQNHAEHKMFNKTTAAASWEFYWK